MIESIIMDLTKLKTDTEIEKYIMNQLGNYFPDPELLIFDYHITGSGCNKKALVSYTLKDNVEKVKEAELVYPHLLFKQIFKKDGHYLIFYTNRIFEVKIEDKILFDLKHYYLENYNQLTTDEKAIIISDLENYQFCINTFKRPPLKIELLYKKCKKNLFQERKKKKIKYLIILIPFILLGCFTEHFKLEIDDNIQKLNLLIAQNKTLEREISLGKSLDQEYQKLYKEVLIIESLIPPDLYSIFYNLELFGDDFKIIDLNYSNRSLNINAISPNSINLLSNLNKNIEFTFKQTSTITKSDYECINFSGDIKCP